MNATITDIGAAKRKRFFDAATSALEGYVTKLEATGVKSTDAVIVLRTFKTSEGYNVSFVRMQHVADAFGPEMLDLIENNRALIGEGQFVVGVVDERDKWSWFSFGLSPEPTLEQKTAWHFRRQDLANQCWDTILDVTSRKDKEGAPRDSYVVTFDVSGNQVAITSVDSSRFADVFDEWTLPVAQSMVRSLNRPGDFALLLRDEDGVSGAIRNTSEAVS